jgi:hypothetical protein
LLLVAPPAGSSTPPHRNNNCRLLDILIKKKIARVHRAPQVEIILRMRLHARLPHPLFLTLGSRALRRHCDHVAERAVKQTRADAQSSSASRPLKKRYEEE